MVNYLLDTNVISEIRKGERCDANVAKWYASVDDGCVYLSVLLLGEIRKGIEQLRAKDPVRARELETWSSILSDRFADRVLPIDRGIADQWGRMSSGRRVPAIDALLAATAKIHRMTLVTRNVSDVTDLGADIFNPFAAL